MTGLCELLHIRKKTVKHDMTIFLYTFVGISCTLANKSKLFCRSFALSLDKIRGGSAVSSPGKPIFPVLPLHSPFIIFVNNITIWTFIYYTLYIL